MNTAATVAFLSDFGLDDEFVGVVHAVIARQAPEARVIDVTHQIPPHDVRAGATTLWRAAPWLAPGVILAVVDPGVGTPRRAVALEVGGAGAALVGPDNGLLFPAASLLGPVTAAVEIKADHDAPGVTFAARDVFAPAAARLANGDPLHALGAPIEPDSLAGGPIPEPGVEGGRIRAEVIWVDRFGNAQLNVGPDQAAALIGEVDEVRVGDRTLAVRTVKSYGEIDPDQVGLVVDSYGLLALSSNARSAAGLFHLSAGQPVWLCRQRDDPR